MSELSFPKHPERVPEATTEAAPQAIPEGVPETLPETLIEAMPETLPETLIEAMPETMIEAMPETMPETMIDIVVNGDPRRVAAGTTVVALLAELGLADRRVAVERNREVVPRADHARTALAAGDQIELVTFVGGG